MDDWDRDAERDYQERRSAVRLLRGVIIQAERMDFPMDDPETGVSIQWQDSEMSILEDRILVTVAGVPKYEVRFEVKTDPEVW